MAKDKLATDFDDFEDAKTSIVVDTPKDAETSKDVDGVPYCRTHHCRMKRTSGGAKGAPTSYFKCPVDGCDCTAQMIKTKRESVVPPNPVSCPRCSTPEKAVICARSAKHSTAASVVLQCPICEWKSNAMAMPNLAAQHFDARRAARPEPMGIGDR